MLEHLCSNWGLYFTCDQMLSGVGSQDVADASERIRLHPDFTEKLPDRLRLPKPPPTSHQWEARLKDWTKTPQGKKYEKALNVNVTIAHCELLVILLARLYVFRRFLTILGPDTTRWPQHCKRTWLYLQLYPGLLSGGDIFKELIVSINNVFLQGNLDRKLTILRRLSTTVIACIRDHVALLPQDYIVPFGVDESQRAAIEMEQGFSSSKWGVPKGFLRELAKCWNDECVKNHLKKTFIFTGTGLSKALIDDALSSIIMKPGTVEDVHDTGGFDDGLVQARYVREYFPPQIWEQSGEDLMRRVHYWLRGRYAIQSSSSSKV